jgi:hypothetical protein
MPLPMVIPVGENSSPRIRIVLGPDGNRFDLTGGGSIQLLLDDAVAYSYPGGGITVIGSPTDGTIDIQVTSTHTAKPDKRFQLLVHKGSVTSMPAHGRLAIVR